jgi:hypothetical protein
MMIYLRIFLLKFFNRNEIEADRKIVKLLSHWIFLKRKDKFIDYLFEMLDGFKKTKTELEYSRLLAIMKREVDSSDERIIKEFKKMDKESQELLLRYAPKEYQRRLSSYSE